MSETPPVHFSQFVVSLASSALVHLGEMPHPETQKPEKNLPLAQHSIEVLEMLHTKTRGNLDEEEGRLLDAVLTDLRQKLPRA
jgi:hypothetical protein